MPNCSTPGCRGNYTPEDRVPVFKIPDGPPELRHVWLRSLHRDDISDHKMVYVCAKHFQKEDIQYVHTVPRGDGTSYEVPGGRPKLNPSAVPSLSFLVARLIIFLPLQLGTNGFGYLTPKRKVY